MGTMNYADPLGHLETCQSVGRNGINNHVSKFDDCFDKMSELADQFWDIIDSIKWAVAPLSVLKFEEIIGINKFQGETMKFLELLVDYDRWWKDNVEEFALQSVKKEHNKYFSDFSMFPARYP